MSIQRQHNSDTAEPLRSFFWNSHHRSGHHRRAITVQKVSDVVLKALSQTGVHSRHLIEINSQFIRLWQSRSIARPPRESDLFL